MIRYGRFDDCDRLTEAPDANVVTAGGWVQTAGIL